MDTSTEPLKKAKSKITNNTSKTIGTSFDTSNDIGISTVKNRIRNGKRIKELSNQPTRVRKIKEYKFSKQSTKDTVRRIRESQNLIKKGFNVCYALEEFIRASRDNEANKKQ